MTGGSHATYLLLLSVMLGCSDSTVSGGPIDATDGMATADSPPPLNVDAATSDSAMPIDAPPGLDCGAQTRYAVQVTHGDSSESSPILVADSTFRERGVNVDLTTDEFSTGTYHYCYDGTQSVWTKESDTRTTFFMPFSGANVGASRVLLLDDAEITELLSVVGATSEGGRHLVLEARIYAGPNQVGAPAVGAVYQGSQDTVVRDGSGNWVSGTTTSASSAYVVVPNSTTIDSLSSPPGMLCAVPMTTQTLSGSPPLILQKPMYCVSI